jgi:localization factor PodJL
MGLETSWSLMDIPLDARDAAQVAAHREGLSLGEWLTRRILKRYSELSAQEREDAFNQLGHRITEVSGRLDHLEGATRSEPLREAVKKLHQGLGRLSSDLVQTAGQSTIRISALSRDLEDVLGKIEEIRGTVSQAGSGFDQRIEAVQQGLDAAAQNSEQKHDALARRLDRLGHTFDEAFAGIAHSSGTLQSEVVRVAQDLQTLDGRFNEAQHQADQADRKTREQAGHVADKIENFGIRLDRVCAATAESASTLHSRIQHCQEKLDRLDAAENEHSATVAGCFESLDGKIAETAADVAGMCGALDHRLLLVQQNLQALDQRHAETVDALAKGRVWVADKISETRSESSSACAALDARIGANGQALYDLDRRHGEAMQALSHVRRGHENTASVVQVLEGGVAALRTRVSAIEADTRVADHDALLLDLAGRAVATEAVLIAHRDKFGVVDGALDRFGQLGARHGEAIEAARRSQEAAASATAALEQRLQALAVRAKATDEMLETRREKIDAVDDIFGRLGRLEAHYGESTKTLADTRSAVTAMQPLEGSVAALQAQIARIDTQDDAAVREFAEARRARESTASALQSLESRVTGLQTEFAGITADSHNAELVQRFEDISGRTQALETGLDLVQEHTKVVGDLLTSLDARIAGESRKQQDGLADLKSVLLDEISRSLFAQVEAEARKQEQALEELHANFVANTLKALEDKLDEDARRQHVAMAELATNLAPASPHPALAASEVVPLVMIDATASDPHQTAHDTILDLTMPAPDTFEHEPIHDLTMPAPETFEHEPIHDFTTPAPETFEPEPIHDAADHIHDEPPPFAEAALTAVAALSALGAASEPLEPAMVFANEPAVSPIASPASFLSAARQSLQEAAQKNETVSRPKSLFGLSLFRKPGPGNNKQNDTTSYALLAGVALVAIVAIAVTTGELVKRSQPEHLVGSAPATLATPRHAVRRAAATPARTTAKAPAVSKTTAAPRLEQLANAGDPQAQLLLGLQDIGTDTTDAAKWLGAAAQQGMPVAQYRVATLYAQGHGVAPDAAKAFHWYAAAAKGGNRKAMSNLAVDYAQGSGTTKDPQEAALWFSKAAELGLVDAQFDLAVLYERGLGVPQSLIDAYRWYLVAAKAGDRESKDRVDALASQLSPQDRAAAETAAAQFKPAPMNASANEPQ